MAYTDILNLKHCSLGYATQSDIVTPAAGSFTWLNAHDISITPEAPSAKPARTRGSRGSAPLNTSGRVWYRLSFKTYMHGQGAAYDFTSDPAGIPGAWGLHAGIWAAAAGAYHATGVSPSDGNTVTLINDPLLGSLIAFANSSNVVGGMGFLQSKSGGGPYTANLFEDLPAQPGSGNKQVPTTTRYPTNAKQAFEFAIRGEPTVQDMRVRGAIFMKRTFRYDEADALLAEWEFMCYGGLDPYGGAGGLQSIASYLTLDSLIGAGNGRIVLGSNVFTSFDDGTADAEGHCDVRDIVITDEVGHRPVTIPSLTEGVKDVALLDHMTTVSFQIPHVEDFDGTTVNAFEEAFRNETVVSFSLYMGDTPGKLFAFNMPRGQVSAFPGYPESDNALGRGVTLEATDYDGDGASTDAGNKPSRWAIG